MKISTTDFPISVHKDNDNQVLIIVPDTNPQSPREYGTIMEMYCYDKFYFNRIGKHIVKCEEEMGELLEDENILYKIPFYGWVGNGRKELSIKPTTGQLLGYCVVTEKTFKEHFGDIEYNTNINLNKLIEDELQTYCQFLNGDIYGFMLYDEHGVMIDSCYGFYSIDEIFHHISTTTNQSFEKIDYKVENYYGSVVEV